VIVFSGDGDMQQCLAWDRTTIYRAPGLFITKESFAEQHGFPVQKYNIYKALIGDKSDNIKGVEGFGPVKAALAIKVDSVPEDVYEMSGEKGVDEFRLALSLVNLDTKIELDLESMYMGAPIFEEKPLKKKYNEKVLLEVQRLKEEF